MHFFFGEVCVQIFHLSFFLYWDILSCCNIGLYISNILYFKILDTSTFSGVHLANIFSQSITCLFIFLKVFFEKQNFLSFNEVQFPKIFSLVKCAFVFHLRNLHLTRILKDFFLFSSRSFVAVDFSFSSMIHFCWLFNMAPGIFFFFI